ncbi:MAG: Na/Pi cotransporter family protein [Erysipelotrichaceae bacterium]|nr:Na/Pi cotransporter family protein [Erysipelotrichaceae bacterium]
MSRADIVSALLQLIAGVGIFMIACTRVSSNLEAISSNKLKELLTKISDNTLLGILTGAITTAIIQSSSATTVMAIGFVDAGIMSLNQAANIIYGGEIGTTITGQIVSLGMFGTGTSVSMNVIFGAMTGIGVFVEMALSDDKKKTICKVVSGLGMLFVGLNLMSSSMKSFAQLEEIRMMLAGIDNFLILTLAGAVLTAIIQSSSAMTSIAITMVVSGLITIDQGIYITLGANIGTCFTGFLAGSTGGVNARRTSMIQTIFNIAGVILALIINEVLIMVTHGSVSFGTLMASMFPGIPQTQLAMFHTIFNILSVVLVIPVAPWLIELSKKIVPDEIDTPVESDEPHMYYINSYMLKTPVIAVKQLKNEILNMAEQAMNNFNMAIDGFASTEFVDKNEFDKVEEQLDYVNNNLPQFITALSSTKISPEDRAFLSAAYHVIIDIERIGDYAVNLTEYIDTLRNDNRSFSEEANEEIQILKGKINDLYASIIEIYRLGNVDNIKEAQDIEDGIDEYTKLMEENHIHRMSENICTPRTGAIFLSMITELERVADHLMNIAQYGI